MFRRYADRGKLLLTVVLLGALSACAIGGGSGNTKPVGTAAATPKTASAVPKSTEAKLPVSALAANTTEADFQRALQLMQARDYGKAEPLLTELSKRQPQLAGPRLNLGILYARTNRKPQAVQTLRQGLSLNPNSAAAQNQLGILLRESGELRAAEQAYQAALKATPAYANAHLNLGVLYDVHLRQPALALKHYEQYRQLAPADGARVAVWIAALKQRTTGQP